MMDAIRAKMCGRFAPLIMLVDEEAELGSIVTEFNKVATDTATERLCKQCRKKKPWPY